MGFSSICNRWGYAMHWRLRLLATLHRCLLRHDLRAVEINSIFQRSIWSISSSAAPGSWMPSIDAAAASLFAKVTAFTVVDSDWSYSSVDMLLLSLRFYQLTWRFAQSFSHVLMIRKGVTSVGVPQRLLTDDSAWIQRGGADHSSVRRADHSGLERTVPLDVVPVARQTTLCSNLC